MTIETDVAIIGAGPYGLSIAAYLNAAGVAFKIFGEPMQTWRSRMPRGMHLKSDGFASSLFDPGQKFTLRDYCIEKGIPYDDLRVPVALETFWHYGLAFQQRLVPSLDTRRVDRLERTLDGFTLTLSDGQTVRSYSAIVATGISHYDYLPTELAHLDSSFCSHSADNADLSKFKNQGVLVIGRGASSTDIAALLLDQNASVQIVSRRPVSFNLPPSAKPRPLWWRLRNPNFGLGPNFRSAVYTLMPGIFHRLPLRLRARIVSRHLGPSAVYFIREKLVGKVPMHSGCDLQHARVRDGRVHCSFARDDGTLLELAVDHVIAGTGYRVDLARLPFIDAQLRSEILLEGASPRLTQHFESSVPGLYFVGLASALAFGPLTRFAHGAGFTARRISAHFRQRRSRPAADRAVSVRP